MISNKTNHIYNATFIWALAISIYTFKFSSNFTIYQWPEMDNFPFFLRFYNPEFLKGNFIVESVLDGPRNIFQYTVILLSQLFGGNWKLTLIILNFVSLSIFPLLYLSVIKFGEEFFKQIHISTAFFICIIWIALYHGYGKYTHPEIAGWEMDIPH